MPSALHHSSALEVMSLTYGHDCTSTTSWDAASHLVGCAGMRHFALHSHAFMKNIKVIYPCFYEALSSGYVPSWRSLMLFWYHVKWKLYVKLMFNSTCDLNGQSKQVCLLRCFISPLLYSIQVLDACLEGKGISCTSHTPLFRDFMS
jgi:hypothetical protein